MKLPYLGFGLIVAEDAHILPLFNKAGSHVNAIPEVDVDTDNEGF